MCTVVTPWLILLALADACLLHLLRVRRRLANATTLPSLITCLKSQGPHIDVSFAVMLLQTDRYVGYDGVLPVVTPAVTSADAFKEGILTG